MTEASSTPDGRGTGTGGGLGSGGGGFVGGGATLQSAGGGAVAVSEGNLFISGQVTVTAGDNHGGAAFLGVTRAVDGGTTPLTLTVNGGITVSSRGGDYDAGAGLIVDRLDTNKLELLRTLDTPLVSNKLKVEIGTLLVNRNTELYNNLGYATATNNYFRIGGIDMASGMDLTLLRSTRSRN